jgi:uncharacterized damage-inducible protein DinB
MAPDDHHLSNAHIALDTLGWWIEEAFSGGSQSLMANLENIRDEDWTTIPTGGGRSIADILEHIGWCEWMYGDYAFGNASLRGDQPPQIPAGGARTRPKGELLEWLKAGHMKWLASIRLLNDDAELDFERLANWGEYLPTRFIIRIMLEHDVYHAGEINHLRAVLQGNDQWEYA